LNLPFRVLLCPTDLSPLGNLAVPVAYRLAGQGSVIHLVNIDAPAQSGNPLYPEDRPKGAPTPADVQAGKAADRQRLEALVPADARTRGITSQLDVIESHDVALGIEAEARKRGADVIVLGSHGRWGLSRLAHGESVALRLMHEKDLNVIVVHSDKP
jgi:nucleotide-binding universal stress UspA family protein